MSALWPIQVATATRLNTWPAFAQRGFRFHDGRPPQGTPTPYGVIDSPDEEPADVLGVGHRATLMLHIFSNTPGSSREAQQLADEAEKAMRQPLAIAGLNTATRKEFRDLLIEADGVRHAAIRYGFLALGPA